MFVQNSSNTVHLCGGLFGMQQWDTLQCGYGGTAGSEAAAVGYARRRALIALFLWLAILPASIIFARWQASAARTYDRVHTRSWEVV